jgi:glutathione S-transferase
MAAMKLLYQTHSPYARKVLVAAHEMGLHRSLEVVHHETSPTRRNEEVFALNPLGKVPVLICDDGTVVFDSNVICEYLDGLHQGPRLIPSDPQLRYRALRMQALAQGIADAGITARWERERRPAELRWPVMHDGQIQKIAAACDFVERGLVTPGNTATTLSAATAIDAAARGNGDVSATPTNRHPDIGDISLATALSWIEFRRVYDFLTGRPRLAHWYAALCARPSMRATTLEGQTHD